MPERYYRPEMFFSYGPFEITPSAARLLRSTKQRYSKVVHTARKMARTREFPTYIRMGEPGELERRGGQGTEGMYVDQFTMNAWLPEKRPGSTLVIDPQTSYDPQNTMAHELMHSILGKLPPALYTNEAAAWRSATSPEEIERLKLTEGLTASEQRSAQQLLRYYLK